MGSVFLGVGIYLIISNRDFHERLGQILPQGFSPGTIMLVLVIGAPPMWGAIGAVSGIFYNVVEESSPNGGLGSSNFVFTVAVLFISILAVVALFIIRRRILRWALVPIVAFAAIFGWLLPALGDWR